MKVLLLLIPFVSLLSCSQKKNSLANIDRFTIKDTIVTVKEELKQEQNEPYTSVEQMPTFPGGEVAMMNFIRNNLTYPVVPDEEALIGRTAVRFVVSKTGDIKNVAPAMDRYKGFAITDTLISVVKRMPRWIPGKQNGETVDVYYTMPLLVRPQRR